MAEQLKQADRAPATPPPMTMQDADGYLVNLSEFAGLVDKSLPTVRKIIADNPDFPVERRGARGTDYVIDARAGHHWLQSHDAEVQAAQRQRIEDLRQLKLEIWGSDGVDQNDAAVTLTPQEESTQLDNRLKALKLAREHGEILMKADVQRAWAQALARLRDDVQGLSPMLTRELSLNRQQRNKLDADLAAMLHRLADKLGRPETYGVDEAA